MEKDVAALFDRYAASMNRALAGRADVDEAAYDVEVWRACLALLPPKSPKRAAVVSRIERIERELR